MYETILNDIKEAMISKNRTALDTLRMVKSEIVLKVKEEKRDLTDEEITNIILKQIKTRKESVNEFLKYDRVELAAKTEMEITCLNKYLGDMMSSEEIEKFVLNVINNAEVKEFKTLMPILAKELKGKADIKEVSELLKNNL